MRNAFADELTRRGGEDPLVVMLSGDIGNRLFDKFKARHPSRFFNCGVAEANMMGVAAGMAMNGLRPVAYTITPFVTTRCLEQIRTDVCYHEAPVTIVAVGAGLSYSGLGPTHHACEDIAFLKKRDILAGMMRRTKAGIGEAGTDRNNRHGGFVIANVGADLFKAARRHEWRDGVCNRAK